MDLYPAIDIKGGRVVRRAAGAAPDPVGQAETYLAQGARWLHVVDMDRAFRTGSDNAAWLRRICALGRGAVQVGGNLTDVTWVAEAIEVGAARVVLGTAAALNSGLLERLVQVTGPARAALAVEMRGGRVVLRGREAPPDVAPAELARRARAVGIEVVVHRDLDRDGQLGGADLEGAASLLASGAAVIAAGGVGALDEVRAAQALGLHGLIMGRALHERRVSLPEALACLR